jgi:hypothetical protein
MDIPAPSDVWLFRRSDRGWIWQRVSAEDTPVAESRTTFPDMDECVRDARQHGYERV